jgi:NADPH2:quinone reductase
VIVGTSSRSTKELVRLCERIEEGKLRTALDRRYRLEQMAEAHRYVESGQTRGSVVITLK